MKNWLCVISAATTLMAGSAFAADLPSRTVAPLAPVMLAPIFSWTGFYLGVNGGGEWSRSNWSFSPQGTSNRHHENSGIFGGQVGYNLQFGGNWVAGIEGSGEWADAEGGSVCPNPAFSCNTKEDYLADISGRLGYAMGTTLFYVKGGAAFTGLDHYALSFVSPSLNEEGGNRTETGYLIGGGIEHAFAHNWTAKIEYNYMDFGRNSFNLSTTSTGAFVQNVSERHSTSVVKVGLNYLFNTSAPAAVSARY